jgi:hypothetical protein
MLAMFSIWLKLQRLDCASAAGVTLASDELLLSGKGAIVSGRAPEIPLMFSTSGTSCFGVNIRDHGRLFAWYIHLDCEGELGTCTRLVYVFSMTLIWSG